jgi:hypothetical protein
MEEKQHQLYGSELEIEEMKVGFSIAVTVMG